MAPLRFLNQRTFDHLFILAGVLIREGPRRRFPRRASDIELRLLRLKTGHSRLECTNGRSWPGAAVPNVRAKQTTDKLRISAKGWIAAPAPKGSRRPKSRHPRRSKDCPKAVGRYQQERVDGGASR